MCPFEPGSYKATRPKLAVEVLSPSTRDFDTLRKVPEYQAVDTIDVVLVVDPNAPDVTVWSRGPDQGWRSDRIEEMGASVELPSLGLAMPLAEIYDGVVFPVEPVRYLPDAR